MEPVVSWGLRMAITAIIPVIWGLITNRIDEASWITLTAECICWVELKGSFPQRIRVLTAGMVLAVISGILGSITAGSIWMSVVVMLFIGFFSGLFKNLGDRGSGLAISVYVIFILTNAFPLATFQEIQHRTELILIGGWWSFFISMGFSVFLPQQGSYRRSIALIWRANASLLMQVAKGWDGKSIRSNVRNVYLKEKEVRSTIDSSFQLFEKMAHQMRDSGTREYYLAQLRKASSLTATAITAISEELESFRLKELPIAVQIKMNALLLSLKQTADRLSIYILSLKPEDRLLINIKIGKVKKRISLLQETAAQAGALRPQLERICHFAGRAVRLMETSGEHIDKMGRDMPVYSSYSMLKTLFILHPQHWIRNLRLLFHLNSLTARYAFRSAVAAALAIFLYKWFEISRGYWIVFTVMVVVQPYIGATIQKAVERVTGTIIGGLAAGIIIQLETRMEVKAVLLFFSFFFMVYFVRKKYPVAVFFITISLVLLFHVEEHYDPSLIFIRAIATVMGAFLGITAGFALFPGWDRRQLPRFFTRAIQANHEYFVRTFFGTGLEESWTKYKRMAELANSNAFDSFNRYVQEPGMGKKIYIPYYQLIIHNIRITRELNNIHLEYDLPESDKEQVDFDTVALKLEESIKLFQEIEQILIRINPAIYTVQPGSLQPRALSHHQLFYLEKILSELRTMYPGLLHYFHSLEKGKTAESG